MFDFINMKCEELHKANQRLIQILSKINAFQVPPTTTINNNNTFADVSDHDVSNNFDNNPPQLGMDMPMEELRMYQDIIQRYNMGDNVNSMIKQQFKNYNDRVNSSGNGNAKPQKRAMSKGEKSLLQQVIEMTLNESGDNLQNDTDPKDQRRRDAKSIEVSMNESKGRKFGQRHDRSHNPRVAKISIDSTDLSGFNIENRGLIYASQENTALTNRLANPKNKKKNKLKNLDPMDATLGEDNESPYTQNDHNFLNMIFSGEEMQDTMNNFGFSNINT